MAKIRMSLEVPIAHLEETEGLVDFHFCIASTAWEHTEYFEYYKRKAAEPESFVMLDNGAYEAHVESEATLSPRNLFKLASAMQPHVVWAPDVLFNRRETEELTKEFIDICKRHEADWQIGYIPQGADADEITQAYLNAPPHHWLGLSFLNPRLEVLAKLCGSIEVPVHMLGLRSLSEIAYWPRMLLTMDTSKPIKAALIGEKLVNLARGTDLLLPGHVVQDRLLMTENIQALRTACDV